MRGRTYRALIVGPSPTLRRRIGVTTSCAAIPWSLRWFDGGGRADLVDRKRRTRALHDKSSDTQQQQQLPSAVRRPCGACCERERGRPMIHVRTRVVGPRVGDRLSDGRREYARGTCGRPCRHKCGSRALRRHDGATMARRAVWRRWRHRKRRRPYPFLLNTIIIIVIAAAVVFPRASSPPPAAVPNVPVSKITYDDDWCCCLCWCWCRRRCCCRCWCCYVRDPNDGSTSSTFIVSVVVIGWTRQCCRFETPARHIQTTSEISVVGRTRKYVVCTACTNIRKGELIIK